jgi:DNA repair exonuclease SbcCD ATPase subunit
MSEREDLFFNFKIEGINDIKTVIDYLEEYQKLVNGSKGQEILTKLKLDTTQFNNIFNSYKTIFEKFETVKLNPTILTSLNTYLQQLQNSLQPLQSNFQNIILNQLKEREEYIKRVNEAENNSLKTARELIEYQREKNKLEQISLENETLKNKLINNSREMSKISSISDTEKQTQLGLLK